MAYAVFATVSSLLWVRWLKRARWARCISFVGVVALGSNGVTMSGNDLVYIALDQINIFDKGEVCHNKFCRHLLNLIGRLDKQQWFQMFLKSSFLNRTSRVCVVLAAALGYLQILQILPLCSDGIEEGWTGVFKKLILQWNEQGLPCDSSSIGLFSPSLQRWHRRGVARWRWTLARGEPGCCAR